MASLELFSNSDEENLQAAKALQQIGCCPRCMLRFLGESSPSSYKRSSKEIEQILLHDEAGSMPVSPCPGCLGVLQDYADETFLQKLASKVKNDGFQFSDYQCSLILPVSLSVRQKAMVSFLHQKFSDVYVGIEEEKIATVKDVWKWSCSYKLAEILDAHFQNRSDFDILLTFTYEDSDKECRFLSDVFPHTFKQRKHKKFGFETFTRANVSKALSQMDYAKFEDCCACPPAIPVKSCRCSIVCTHDAVFVAGRYLKFSRELSQTPWLVDGKRVMASSVQELICQPIIDTFQPTDHRLSSSGREDVDVRMLGDGRPFVVELINPHRVTFSKEEMAALQEKINSSSEDIKVRDLQIVAREDIGKLKEGELSKTKSYSALCWCERELKEEDIQLLTDTKDLVLFQKTPLRVLHRRSAATRERIVHDLRIEPLESKTFRLYLTTQAGTYVKEFVHGDFGRTTPNLGELLKADCDIMTLDVESVDVDWPPKISQSPCLAEQTHK